MKILIEYSVAKTYNANRPGGGVERFCHQLFTLLKKRYDVEMIVPSDTPETELADGLIWGPWESGNAVKLRKEKMKWKLIYQTLDEMAENFDVVIINSDYTSSVIPKMKNLHKVIQINHSPHLFKASMMFFGLINNILVTRDRGGLCLGSGPTTESRIQTSLIRESTRKHLRKQVPEHIKIDRGILDGFLDVNFLPNLPNSVDKFSKKITFVGRAGKDKGADVALKVFSELPDFDRELIVAKNSFVNLEILDELIEEAKNKEVKLTVNPDHEYIIDRLSSSSILFFPSKYETNGIVAFEGAVNGCKVVYDLDEPEHFLNVAQCGFRGPLTSDFVRQVEDCTDFSSEQAKLRLIEKYNDASKLEYLDSWLGKIGPV